MNVHLTLKTPGVFNTTERHQELLEIKDWIEELVEWNKELYSIRFHSSGRKLIVWFEKDEHATLCALRWS